MGSGLSKGCTEVIADRGWVMAVDEIYSGLTYGIDFPSALSVSDGVIVIDGFSKTYAMTGWRLGWMVVPEDLVRPIQKVAQNVFISAPTVAQHAALAAFDAFDEVDAMRNDLREKTGFPISSPEGDWVRITGLARWRFLRLRKYREMGD